MRWPKISGFLLISTLIAGCVTPPHGAETPPITTEQPAVTQPATAPDTATPNQAASATDAAAVATPPATAGAGSGVSGPSGVSAVNRASYIELTSADGSIRKLYPPQSLHLTAGPVWSPDGKWVAVLSATDFIWMVEVASNHWVYVGHATADPKLTKWDEKWTAWWAEISSRPMRTSSGGSLTQIRQGALLHIYLPTHLPEGLKLAYINSGIGSEWAFIGFVDASGKESFTITERAVSGMSPGWIPHQYIDLPLVKDEIGQTAAHVGCRNQDECSVAWTAPDPYIQVEANFPFAMSQAELLKVVASLSLTATEEQMNFDLPALRHIAP